MNDPENIREITAQNAERLFRDCVSRHITEVDFFSRKEFDAADAISSISDRCRTFCPNLIGYTIQISRSGFSNYKYYKLEIRYRTGSVMLKQMEIKVEKEVKEVCTLIYTSDMPKAVKCFIAHNYLADTIRYYNPENENDNPVIRSHVQSAYGALIDKQCVCRGYAEAYKRLMDAANIPCELVSGMILKDGGLHSWNIIELGPRLRYHVDTTWDSLEKGVSHNYFCKGDSFLAEERKWDREYHAPCIDGSDVLRVARLYCSMHREKLTSKGIRNEWLI